MRDWPTDPMEQHNRFIAAMCKDIVETGTFTIDGPNASRVAEINRQANELGGIPGSRPSDRAPSGLAATRVDPGRKVSSQEKETGGQ